MLRSDTVVLGVRERDSEDRSEVNRKRVKVRHRRTILTLPEMWRRRGSRTWGWRQGHGGREEKRGEMRRRRDEERRRYPLGSGDVLTLRTRSLIGDDLWRHSIFRPSSKGNRRNKYGHRAFYRSSDRTRAKGDRCFHRSRAASDAPRAPAPDVEERFLAPVSLPPPPPSPSSPFSSHTHSLSSSLEFPRLDRFSVDVFGPGEVLDDLSRPSASRLWE